MRIRLVLLVSIFAMMSRCCFAQSDSGFLKRATRLLEDHQHLNPIEKVYLHIDRFHYEPGDTIWFKAYVVAGADHNLSAISGVLYTELINDKDSVLSRLNLQLYNGLSYGDFTVPIGAEPGNYRLRAYTNWMRNEGSPGFYDQVIKVGDNSISSATPQLPAPKASPSSTNKIAPNYGSIDVQFFPEGGEGN